MSGLSISGGSICSSLVSTDKLLIYTAGLLSPDDNSTMDKHVNIIIIIILNSTNHYTNHLYQFHQLLDGMAWFLLIILTKTLLNDIVVQLISLSHVDNQFQVMDRSDINNK